jgi:hypothetical protein
MDAESIGTSEVVYDEAGDGKDGGGLEELAGSSLSASSSAMISDFTSARSSTRGSTSDS